MKTLLPCELSPQSPSLSFIRQFYVKQELCGLRRMETHSMGQITLITGGERRRRWSEEDRTRILAAVAEPGAVIADIARQADVCSSLIYKWRRDARCVTAGR